MSAITTPGILSPLILLKPLGRPLSLTAGETLEAVVTDLFPPDGVTLKLNGTFIPARTSVPIERGETLLLKVTSCDEKTGQVTLQITGRSPERRAAGPYSADTRAGPQDQATEQLLKELSELQTGPESKDKASTASPAGGRASSLPPAALQDGAEPEALRKIITRLIKTFAPGTAPLSPDLKARLQEALQQSLKATGQSIHSRMTALAESLPTEMRTDALAAMMRASPLFTSGAPRGPALRQALQDTGVLLEARLKAITLAAPDQAPAKARAPGSLPLNQGPVSPDDCAPSPAPPDLKGDLKANLLRLGETLKQVQQPGDGTSFLRTLTASVGLDTSASQGPHQEALRTIDGLLRDIETYQLLSKATESLHTFLPPLWDSLRDGEISFRKKQRGSSRGAYSCRLTLDLERLGTLSAIIVMQNGRFTVTFRADQPSLRDALRSDAAALGESFLRQGLTLAGTNVSGPEDRSFDDMDAAWSVDAGLSIKV